MLQEKKIIRRYWSTHDLDKLKSMAAAKAGAKNIAEVLRRTQKAVTLRASQEGVSLSAR